MSNFEQYVAGKTIAVVGPAPLVGNQRAEIDAHDIVYRVASYADRTDYTERVDIAFLNGDAGRKILDEDYDHCRPYIDNAAWWVYKSKSRAYRPQGNERVCHAAPNVKNMNAITAILWDLTHFHPESVTVFGSDLYAAGPGKSYLHNHDPRPAGRQAQGIIMHHPMQQFRAHQAVQRTGLIAGDDRYLAAVSMTEEQYKAVIDQWQNVYESAKQEDATLT
jgi:hypothetical protein